MAAARVPVFLLDQNQVVRPGEMGTVEDIERHARSLGLDVHRIQLDEQFRCGGSELYIQWVLRLLALEPGGPIPWEDDSFALEVVDSPQEMEHRLRGKLGDGYGARMTAGYCWPWSDPRQDGSLVPDVSIGTWSRPWNVKGERAVGGAPPAALWATADGGFEQVGCVYTAQGFEYDWNGVIFGPDLVWRERPVGQPARVQQGSRLPQPRPGRGRRLRCPGAQRLQGPAHARDGRDVRDKRGRRDAGDAALPRDSEARCGGTGDSCNAGNVTTAPESAAPARVGRLASISIDCPDPDRLAGFYAPLLGMRRMFTSPDGRVIALSDGGGIWVTLMKADDYAPPTWPQPGQFQQMHLDLAVTDIETAVAGALALGAREAEHQPHPQLFRVLLDPAGHPFCLTTAVPD